MHFFTRNKKITMTNKPNIEALLRNTQSIGKLEKEKYTTWSLSLDVETLKALLWLIGEYGTNIILNGGHSSDLPTPELYDENPAKDGQRKDMALNVISMIQVTNELAWHLPSDWDLLFSNESLAFNDNFCQQLSNEIHTRWAKDLSERLFVVLLWMVAEYAECDDRLASMYCDTYCQQDHQIDTLRMISDIQRGKKMSLTEVKTSFRESEAYRESVKFPEFIVTPNFANNIDIGKYARWGHKIDKATLESLLWLIGVYGDCINNIQASGNEFPEHIFTGISITHKRTLVSLQHLFTLYNTGTLSWHMISEWDNRFSNDGNAFYLDFSKRLAKDNFTQWAADLSERALALIFWMIGSNRFWRKYRNAINEYFLDHAINHRENIQRLYSALSIISEIHSGQSITVNDIKNRIEL